MAAPETAPTCCGSALDSGSRGVPEGWHRRRIPLPYVLLLLTLAATWSSVSTLTSHWWAVTDYHYGFMVAGLSLWWLAEARDAIEFRDLRAPPLAVTALLPVLLAWLVAVKGHSALAQQLLVPIVLGTVVYAVAGTAGVRRAAAPLLYLYFAVPIWDYLVPPLRRTTTLVVGAALRLLQIPALVDGNIVTLPAGQFQIAEDCSGRRYLVVALAIAFAAGVVQRMTWVRCVMFLSLAAGLALVANWIRVLVVIVSGYVTKMSHYFVAVEHQSLGWAIFALLVATIVAIATRWPKSGARPNGRSITAPIVSATPWAGGVTALLLTGASVWASLGAGDRLRASRLGALPVLVDRWQGPLPADSGWSPRFVGAAEAVRAAYVANAGRVEIYVNNYGPEQPGAKLVYFDNTLLAPHAWTESDTVVTFEPLVRLFSSSPPFVDARSATGELWAVSYVYRVGTRSAMSPLAQQLLAGVEGLAGAPATGLVAVAARCETDCGTAHELLKDFWAGPAPMLIRMLPETLEPAVRSDQPPSRYR